MTTPLTDCSVLIVGGAGFVGSNLARELLTRDVERITIVDNLLSSERENVPDDDRVEFIEGSITESAVRERIRDEYEQIYHLATFHGNQSSIARPVADNEHSLRSTLFLLETVREFDTVERVVYTSTGCALAEKGNVPARPVTEAGRVPLSYDSPYQISKVAGEMYCNHYSRLADIPIVRARFQNVYGPHEVLGAGEWRGTEHTIWRNVVPTFIYRALKGLPIEIHGDGSASRDFIYVEDVADGLIRMATTDSIEGEVFNVASGEESTIETLAETIHRITDSELSIDYISRRDWDRSVHRVGSTEKASAELGFEATTDLEAGLTRTVEWTEENFDYIEACIEQHAEYQHNER